MGSPYTILEHKFLDITCDKDTDIVVEIGTGAQDGSTEFLCNWANERDLPFYSIDLNPIPRYLLKHLNANFVVQSGSEWCKNVLPTLNKKIKVLYLDNFDYPYDSLPLETKRKQEDWYTRHGLSMTVENSMAEHKLQTEYCLPYMAEESLILMDDTYYDPNVKNPLPDQYPNWYGKCATAMPLMVTQGYSIVRDQEYDINYAARTRQLNQ